MTGLDWHSIPGVLAERDPVLPALCRTRRQAPWRLRPDSVDAVQRIVRAAGEQGQPLYPVSAGRNWGYGSSLPARDGSAVLDLSGLQAIGPVDAATASVRIEAGVTQAALAAALADHAPSFWLNVTGSGAQTSVIGNALERGIGYSGPRDADVFAFEVVLADGTLHRPEAAGPDTDRLWAQANFGVVVAARVRLRRRQQSEQTLILRGALADLVHLCRSGWEEGLLSQPVHIGEPGRNRRLGAGLLAQLQGAEPSEAEVKTLFPESEGHTGITAVHGRHRVVAQALAELRRLSQGRVTIQAIDAPRLDRAVRWLRRCGLKRHARRFAALRPLLALTWGEPSDAGLAALDPAGRSDPDRAAEGAIYLNAVSVPDPRAAEAVAAIVRGAWTTIALTRIVTSAHQLITIITVHFVDAESDAAHAAARRIGAELRQQGFPAYRLGINDDAPVSEVARRIKRALDPAGILAPGRYGMT